MKPKRLRAVRKGSKAMVLPPVEHDDLAHVLCALRADPQMKVPIFVTRAHAPMDNEPLPELAK